MVKVLVFGDSITWGAFDLEKGGWADRLKTHFLKGYSEWGIQVYNLGVSSNDTRGVLQFLEQEIARIAKIEPEDNILLFSIGTNDPRYLDRKGNYYVPLGEFEQNLKRIISVGRKHSDRLIFTGLMKVDERLTKPWKENEYWENEDLERYDRTLRSVCRSEKVDFIPLWEVIGENDLCDGLHPDAGGHEKIFRKVLEYFEQSNLIRAYS